MIYEGKGSDARSRQRSLILVSLGEEVYPMSSKITLAQLSPAFFALVRKSKALSRIIILGALVAGARSSGTVR